MPNALPCESKYHGKSRKIKYGHFKSDIPSKAPEMLHYPLIGDVVGAHQQGTYPASAGNKEKMPKKSLEDTGHLYGVYDIIHAVIVCTQTKNKRIRR